MEILGTYSNESTAIKCLKSVFEHARNGDSQSAFAASFLYFEDLLPHRMGIPQEELNVEKQCMNARNCHLRYGLIFNARLARYFGQFDKAYYFIVEAVQLSQRSKDFCALQLALLERCALEISRTRHATLGRFVRNETCFLNENEMDGKFDKNFSTLFEENSVWLNAASNENAVTTIAAQLASNNNNNNPLRVESDGNELADNNYLSQQIAICEKYLRAISLTIRCESQEIVSALLRRCIAFDMHMDFAAHAKIVREAARAAICTIQVVNCSAHPSEIAHYLLDDIIAPTFRRITTAGATNSLVEPRNSEAQSILYVNTAYAYALDGDFEKALELVEMAKKRFSDKENPMAAHHWMVAEACIKFDCDLFNGAEPDTEILSCFSPTEADFRSALIAANCNENFKALKILKNRLSILQIGTDILLVIRCLLALGVTYCEGGAFKSAIKTLQDALEMAESRALPLYAAMARRRIAYANISCINKSNISSAEENLAKCAVELERINAPRIERGMFFVTKLKLLMERRKYSPNKEALEDEAISFLNRAHSAFAKRYPQLEKNIYEEGYAFGESFGNEKICQACKKRFDEKLVDAPEYLNWFLL